MEFPDAFSEVPGTTKECEHKIITPLDRVVRTPVRPIPLALQPMLQEEVEKMLQSGIMEESHSLWHRPHHGSKARWVYPCLH